MTCKLRKSIGWPLVAFALVVSTPVVEADEADDIQAMVDRARRGASDLRRLDERKVADADIKVIDIWLDEAWQCRSEQRFDDARRTLDRVEVQKDMIREAITASIEMAKAAALEAEVKAARARSKALAARIDESKKRKAAMEAQTK